MRETACEHADGLQLAGAQKFLRHFFFFGDVPYHDHSA